MAAKTVLEGLGPDDSCQNENPVKNESDTKVKKVIFFYITFPNPMALSL